MIKRLQNLHLQNSFFLFGARGVGKSTLIEAKYKPQKTLWLDLLLFEEEEKFSKNPDELLSFVRANSYKRVVIDEVQKVPKLLDIVQRIMRERPEIQFILTGSSARKLKKGSGNLLAGRAFQYQLYPFSVFELKESYNLDDILEFGSLPEVFSKKSEADKKEFLKSYTQTYLKEEVVSEQIVRKVQPFRNFLEIAAQQNGEIINHSSIANDIRVDSKTVQNYFSILEDTLVGFLLYGYIRSVRKQLTHSPKFYFFDTGVKRALEKNLDIPLKKATYPYGKAFEHRVILECFYLNEYFKKDFNFYYFRDKNTLEVDLIIERPNLPDILLEIKSSEKIEEKHIKHLLRVKKIWKKQCIAQVWSQEKNKKILKEISCLPWKEGLQALFF